jgi:hypothetical protein
MCFASGKREPRNGYSENEQLIPETVHCRTPQLDRMKTAKSLIHPHLSWVIGARLLIRAILIAVDRAQRRAGRFSRSRLF